MEKHEDTKITLTKCQKLGILVAVILLIAIFVCLGILIY